MSATSCSLTLRSQSRRTAGIAIGAIALLAMTGLDLSAEAPSKDEVLTLTTVIQVPNKPLANVDISYADPVMQRYFLGDRSNQAVDIVDTTKNTITQTKPVMNKPVFSSGPNGVWTVNHKEIWAGDGNSLVRVFDAASGVLTTSISTLGSFGADEGCFDPNDQLVVVANNKELPWPWISFISTSGPSAYTVVKQIIFNGLAGSGGVMATNGIEQCKWDAKTGKIYLNIPANNGPTMPPADSVPGAVVVIDPVSMSVVNVFTIPLSACTGPMGMAIGPENQILLGCSANGTPQNQNSAIINKQSGAVESILTGYGGTDEVWFSEGDGHYIVPFCPAACRATSSPAPEKIGVIDAKGFRADQSFTVASATATPPGTGSNRRSKSVAADSSTNQIYVPILATGGGPPTFLPTICSTASNGVIPDSQGCIAVFTLKTAE
jgi:hypothetical protein